MKTIKISSTKDLFVYGTAYTENKMAGKDGLSLNPSTWTGTQIHIIKGVGTYPSEIKEWATIKSLVKSNVIVISEEGEGVVSTEQETAVANKVKADNLQVEEEKKTIRAKKKASKLEELADKMLDNQLKNLED